LSQRPSDPLRETTDVESDRVVLDDNRVALSLFGEKNANLKRIELETGARLHSRGNELTFLGPATPSSGAPSGGTALPYGARGRPVGRGRHARGACAARGCQRQPAGSLLRHHPGGQRARPIAPKGLARSATSTPSASATSCSPSGLRERQDLSRHGPGLAPAHGKAGQGIVLTGGARSGRGLASCGSMEEKVSPYLRPLYDALHDMMDFDRAHQLVERGMIGDRAIAFMRGVPSTIRSSSWTRRRTPQRADEDVSHRLGYESKAVITGDVTRSICPTRRSG